MVALITWLALCECTLGFVARSCRGMPATPKRRSSPNIYTLFSAYLFPFSPGHCLGEASSTLSYRNHLTRRSKPAIHAVVDEEIVPTGPGHQPNVSMPFVRPSTLCEFRDIPSVSEYQRTLFKPTRSVGQPIAGRALGWSGPSRMNNK